MTDFKPGDRIALLPHLDQWLAGHRFGTVEGTTETRVYVRLDQTDRIAVLRPTSIKHID